MLLLIVSVNVVRANTYRLFNYRQITVIKLNKQNLLTCNEPLMSKEAAARPARSAKAEYSAQASNGHNENPMIVS